MKELKVVMRPAEFESELRRLCQDLKDVLGESPTIVELGSYMGESSVIFAQEFPKGLIICIDSWEGGFDDADLTSFADYIDVEEQFDLRMSRYSNIRKIKGYSTDYSIECDMVYIDACHKYECVKNDIIHWGPFVKKVMSGHDYNTDEFINRHPHIAGVKVAINELLSFPDKTYGDGSWYKLITKEVSQPKNIYWFTGLNTHNKSSYLNYIKMYKVAVITAKQTNPFLKPVLILDGDSNSDIEELIKLGVTVINHRVTFYDELKNHYGNNTTAYGAFLRVDIPIICEILNIDDEYVLYTDNDVMFISEISEILEKKPDTFMCAGEFTKVARHWDMNSGVMWINWRYLQSTYKDFVEFIKNNLNKFNVYDQDAYKMFYNSSIGQLNYKFNYKPYWGPFDDIKILHFHGPKPTFTENDYTKFPYQHLITPFFHEMKDKFNEIYDNNYLLNT